ncbi:hypothetical protein BJ138DRAFT_1121064 [Hygrophoropsis aurantiaca]|uniref:Uncharacterized protein n=1 Tax=Hygrophoropsis aurantiaca TaxID=72124 RepID=A0ACB7ZNZ7_9AGAM|nr:hypothetical protein BJ138DRAFT_1121064 [Hygrophoropsis aurantiaca]
MNLFNYQSKNILENWAYRPSKRKIASACLTLLLTVDDLCKLDLDSPSLFLDEMHKYLALFHAGYISPTAPHRKLSL